MKYYFKSPISLRIKNNQSSLKPLAFRKQIDILIRKLAVWWKPGLLRQLSLLRRKRTTSYLSLIKTSEGIYWRSISSSDILPLISEQSRVLFNTWLNSLLQSRFKIPSKSCGLAPSCPSTVLRCSTLISHQSVRFENCRRSCYLRFVTHKGMKATLSPYLHSTSLLVYLIFWKFINC